MRLTKTQKVIAGMLKENTGRNMLNSGGAYGRHWERNQAVCFEKQPAATLRFSIYRRQPGESQFDIETELNIYHWLVERLEYDEKVDKLFHGKFLKEIDPNDDKSWHEIRREFPEWYAHRVGADEPTGIYGDGSPVEVNTYNGECLLSQVMEYTYFTINHEEFVLLQIHGGCDVRGGYTKPRVFRPDSNYELGIMDNARATITCTGEERHYWDTDDAYHWYYEGTCGMSAGQQLEEYEGSENPEDKGKGKIYVDENHNGYCPLCGEKLELYA